MKGLKENRGFTLIELLAVIVVLAIVMVLAVTTVLPYMESAKKNAFVVEANAARDAASKATSLIILGELKNNEGETNAYTPTTKGYCFTIEQLVMAGVIEKADTDGYDGLVYADKVDGGKSYTYEVLAKSSDYYVIKTGAIKDTDIRNVSDSSSDTNYSKITGNCVANRG